MTSDVATSCLPLFLAHCKKLFVSSTPPEIEKIYNPDEHELLIAISEDEVDAAITAQKSSAPSTIGLSPVDLKSVKEKIVSPLTNVFNWCFDSAHFPSSWLEASTFFLHKKGDRTNPNNFRSINIQNPFVKCYNKILTNRLATYAEQNDLLPKEQYGFRAGRSTFGAVSLLHEIVSSRLKAGKRT